MPAPRLIVDFDGVICDALVECALVTWLGVYPPAPDRPVSSYLDAIPDGFTRRFAKVRDYSRSLDHFLVSHRAAAGNIGSRADFDRIFGAIAPVTVNSFVAGANAARRRCRTEEAPFWLDLHTLYPGVRDLLGRHAGAVAVVTAKDAASVWTILERHGLAHTVLEVIGECRQKDRAVVELCGRRGTSPGKVVFIDDNLGNVLTVAGTGATVRWAAWGYHTPEDRAAAARLNGRRLDLSELPALTA